MTDRTGTNEQNMRIRHIVKKPDGFSGEERQPSIVELQPLLSIFIQPRQMSMNAGETKWRVIVQNQLGKEDAKWADRNDDWNVDRLFTSPFPFYVYK